MKVKGLIATHVNGSYTAVDERETPRRGRTVLGREIKIKMVAKKLQKRVFGGLSSGSESRKKSTTINLS